MCRIDGAVLGFDGDTPLHKELRQALRGCRDEEEGGVATWNLCDEIGYCG